MKNIWRALVAVLFAWASFGAAAQVPQYGASINLDQAKKAIAAGQVEARKNNWPVAIAVVDNSGLLVAYERMDNTQTGSVQVAIDKADVRVAPNGRSSGRAGSELLLRNGYGGASLK